MNDTITITLRIPDAILSPNARVMSKKGVFAKAGKTRAYRQHARDQMTLAMLESKLGPFPWPHAYLRFNFYFATNRNRDEDNFEARMKAGRDGMADAGIVTNDRYFRMQRPTMQVDKKNPRVVVEISRKEAKGTHD